MSNQVFKAYSLLTEKAFDARGSVLRGLATTPTPDRVSDIMVPDGVVFRTRDIKLHLYHDTRLPVGTVSFGKPTSKALPFEAVLPEVEEEGVVRDRVNEARHSLKYNLISAVSIGFRALDGGVEVLKTGGYKFNSWEIVELSLTSVPANPDAVISSFKSMPDGTLPRGVIDAIKAADAGARKAGGYVIQPVRKEVLSLRNPDGSFRLRGQ